MELDELAKTFSVNDYGGVSRTFFVERRIYPNGVYLEATENLEYGCKFAVHGELNSNQQELLRQLIERTRGCGFICNASNLCPLLFELRRIRTKQMSAS